MEALGINIGYLIMQLLLFTILMTVLNVYLFQPVLNALDERKTRIAKGLEDSRQAAIARDNAEAEAKKIMDEARSEAARLRAEAVSGAEESRKGIETQASEQAKVILANADAEAVERRDQALGDLRGQVAAIAIAAANKIVGESLDEKRQHAMIDDFFSKVPASIAGMSGESAEITSALPLSDKEKAAAQKAIKASNINFNVNPDILGGLIVRVDDQVVDDSVAGKMNGLRDNLN